jgi:polyphosphate kinase
MVKKKLKPLVQHINREISWLFFNERVLQEAEDETNPLIERMKFLGIYSNNLDEFFRVRVATINRMVVLKKSESIMSFSPPKLLKRIAEIDAKQEKQFAACYVNIVNALAEQNIFIINEKSLTPTQGGFVRSYFREHIRPVIFPMMLDALKDPNTLQDDSIYLTVVLEDSTEKTKEHLALIRVPTKNVPRFLILPPSEEKKFIILIDDVIRYCLVDVFSIFGYDTFNAYTIKFTRDAELELDNDVSKSFLEIISQSLKQRKAGLPVRFIYDNTMPASALAKIKRKLKISKSDTVTVGGRYHNFKDFMNFPNIGGKELEYEPLPPLPHPHLPGNTSLFTVIKQRDVLLHYPYQSFQYIIDLLREASIDPKVKSIYTTIYRVARNSSVMNALINAARNGKDVTVFMELQARFDEETNIYWTTRLQEQGVKIVHSIPGFKVHSKLLLIGRFENKRMVYYANVATGNFNEETARVYTDDSLLTANPAVTLDVLKIFELFSANFKIPKFNTLVVAPFDMLNIFLKLLNVEIKNVKSGKEAWAFIKLNNLTEETIVKKILEAGEAGVQIRLIVRGSCVIAPDQPGVSKNIKLISIVDRFLEHSRVFIFCNDKKEKYYISSADWMSRNFEHRIEVAVPILDPLLKRELRDMLEIQWSDNTKARLISYTLPNQYRRNDTQQKIRSQVEIYNYLKNKLKEPNS